MTVFRKAIPVVAALCLATSNELAAQESAIITAHNEALRIAKELCISEGRIDQLEVVAEASGGFALRKIGAQGDAKVVRRSSTLEGIANGIDTEIVGEQLANTESARACNQLNYYRILETLLPAPAPEGTDGAAYEGWRFDLEMENGWRVEEHLATAAGGPGEYLVLARYHREGATKDVVFRFFKQIAPEDGDTVSVTYDVWQNEAGPIHDVYWDARLGPLLLTSGDDRLEIQRLRDGAVVAHHIQDVGRTATDAKIAAAAGRLVLGATLPFGHYTLVGRDKRRVIAGANDLDMIRDTVVFANGYALLIGADQDGRGRPNKFVPGVSLRQTQGTRFQISRTSGIEERFYTPGRFGAFHHAILSPQREKALLLGVTYDAQDGTTASSELLSVVLRQDGSVAYERSLPMGTSWMGASLTGSAIWRSETEAFVHFLKRDGTTQRLIINAATGSASLRNIDGDRFLSAPATGCAPLVGAQSGVKDFIFMEACGGEDSILTAHIVQTK